ncbi:sigma-54-dependent Fis family transcriptional regulator [Alkalicoccus chagannorensis]|uniref:sigma-54-dependent Fis family transcriptional regulator n=1 Tax=Alkalicoccus chagannorensis TaxID=427072 RepID=UPI00041BECBC|nr:sigma-54-dependent Fis family transcriptional regulator [Alkalicoccus chagannorensis]
MHILVIAPYTGMADVFRQVQKKTNASVDVVIGDLEQGVAQAAEAEVRGYDAIISRGATAKLIREQSSLPVVNVRITGYDILRTLALMRGYRGKVGIMSYFNVIQGADSIGKLLDFDLTFYQIDSQQDIEGELKKAMADDVQVIIGDVISTKEAEKRGMHGILINSGEEACMEAIEEAQQVLYHKKREAVKIETLIALVEEPAAVINALGRFEEQNDRFAELVRQMNPTNPPSALQDLDDTFYQKLLTDGAPEERSLLHVQGRPYELDVEPFQTGEEGGFILRLKKRSRPVEGDRSNLVLQPKSRVFFNQLVTHSEAMRKAVDEAAKLGETSSSVLLQGPPGVGKTSLAHAMHYESGKTPAQFFYIYCDSRKNYFSEALQETRMELGRSGAAAGTLLLDEVGNLESADQQVLRRFLEEWLRQGDVELKLIATHSGVLEHLVQEEGFDEKLYKLISTYVIHCPELRERREDMEDLIRWFIVAANTVLGKQITGLSEELREYFYQYSWPGNLTQLKNTVHQICIASHGPIIHMHEVQDVLKQLDVLEQREKKRPADDQMMVEIRNRSLPEIEEEVIRKVMELEDHNQSRVADKLGMNRTTLWRKLKAMYQQS